MLLHSFLFPAVDPTVVVSRFRLGWLYFRGKDCSELSVIAAGAFPSDVGSLLDDVHSCPWMFPATRPVPVPNVERMCLDHWQVDVPYQYLRFFMEDDDELKRIGELT